MKIAARWIQAVVMLLSSVAVVAPQSRADGVSRLNVRADIDSALVLVDGTVRGKTPVELDSLNAGVHEVRLLHPDLESWLAPVLVDSIDLLPGETLEIQYRFDRPYLIRSDPSGAEVLVNSRVVGTTPLFMEAGENDSVMQVRKRGFGTAAIDPSRAERGVVQIKLEPTTDDRSEVQPSVADAGGSPVLPLILSGASSIVAGGFSAYFKVQADQVYREYLLTGDPAKLAETRKLDNVAGIALGASEIYLALFSYLLLTQ